MNVVKYQIEDNSNEINISVNIITADGALVTADVDLYINDKKSLKGESKNGEHYIGKSSLGIAKELTNGLLLIEADIDLKLIEESFWEDCFKNLSIKYFLNGGKVDKSFELVPEDIKYKSDLGGTIKTKKYFFLKQVKS
ncbi:hypothetical protein OIU83_18940 [Flavobacterium sp. LS1R49]|uniref:Uncharacterized protein n=1 Tax=Flavobacterium shii TaxID=2987687 RepID=A0A9X2ZI32_9FLAO|nr:hypothetical protein [Flavobacterium shii]MCV9929745.1 hypothetical protein [Flavobacterium shii]